MHVDTVDVFNKGEWSINEFPGWQQKIYEVARAYFFLELSHKFIIRRCGTVKYGM